MNKWHVIGAAVMISAVMAMTAYAGEETEAEAAAPEEGYTENYGEGSTAVVKWIDSGEDRLFAKVYYPESYEEGQVYPVVIMSHGFTSTHDVFEKGFWPDLVNEMNYIAVTFDFAGGSENSLSNPDMTVMSVMTEKQNLDDVLNEVLTWESTDTEQVYLLGQSQGGLVSALEAADRKEEIAGLMMLYPALKIVDDVHDLFASKEDIPETYETMGQTLGGIYASDVYDLDVYGTIAGYKGDVLILHGIADKLVPYEYSVRAVTESYGEARSELFLLGGEKAVHGYDAFREEERAASHDVVKSFLERHVNAEPEEES